VLDLKSVVTALPDDIFLLLPYLVSAALFPSARSGLTRQHLLIDHPPTPHTAGRGPGGLPLVRTVTGVY
jgi:hypothetical protein